MRFSSAEEDGGSPVGAEDEASSPGLSPSPLKVTKKDTLAEIQDVEINSATQLHKGQFGNQFLLTDLTKDQEGYGFRPTTSVQALQLKAIQEHNDKLPPRKKAKESLPEIPAVNVYSKLT